MKRVQHTNTFSMRSSATIGLFYRDLGARWLHDDSRWRPSKEKNGRKRVGGFARCAPLNIYPDWKGKGLGMQCWRGLGMQWLRAWSPWILSFEGGWVGNVARPKYGIFMYTLLNYIRILNRSAGCATHVACYEHIFYEQDDNARAGS